MLANYALALGVLAGLDRYWSLARTNFTIHPRQAGGWLGGIGLLIAAWIGLSMSLIGQASRADHVQVAALAPGWVGSATAAQLFAQTRHAAAQGAQLVVWPEGNISEDPQGAHKAAFQALAKETGVYIVIGYGLRTPAGLRNEATILAPDGRFLGVYGKDHPVIWLGESSLTRGSYPAYTTPLGILGTIICYDLNFTDTARKTAAAGAQLIAVPSNDWRGLAAKQYTNLVFRAVENRLALIKADSGLDSAIIAPTGEIIALAVTDPPQPMIVRATVALGRADAPLIRLGDWLGWLTIAGLFGFILLDQTTRRQARRAARVSQASLANTSEPSIASPT
jgi:apolipoprotein N-acyltransferase